MNNLNIINNNYNKDVLLENKPKEINNNDNKIKGITTFALKRKHEDQGQPDDIKKQKTNRDANNDNPNYNKHAPVENKTEEIKGITTFALKRKDEDIEQNVNLNHIGNKGYTLLLEAFEHDSNTVKLLIDSGLIVLQTVPSNDVRPRILFQLAMKTGISEIVKTIIDKHGFLSTDLNKSIYYKNNNIEQLISNNKEILNDPDENGFTPLQYAIGFENIEAIKLLIKYGVIFNPLNLNDFTTPIYLAISFGNEEIITVLLESVAEAKEHISDNFNRNIHHAALMYAIKCGRENIVELLIRYGANPKKMSDGDNYDDDGYTPLMQAIRYDKKKIAALLIDKYKVDPYQRTDHESPTAMDVAIEDGNIEMVELLLEKEPNLLDYYPENRWTPLVNAIYKKQIEIAMFLIEKGADVNLGTEVAEEYEEDEADEYTYITNPLIQAIVHGESALAKILIEKGADLQSYAQDGLKKSTPLLVAIEENNLQVAKFLIEKGAKLNHEVAMYVDWTEGYYDPSIYTPLTFAIDTENERMVRCLINAGVDVNYVDKKLQTPLFYAIKKNNKDIVNLLLHNKADPNKPQGDIKFTFLQMAINRGNIEIVESLINKGANCKQMNGNGITPLACAIWAHQTAIVRLLIKQDIDFHTNLSKYICQNHDNLENIIKENTKDLNIADKNGLTPLEYAIGSANTKAINLLIQYGADPNLVAQKGSMPPLFYAIGQENEEIIKLLIQKRAKINVFFNDIDTLFTRAIKDNISKKTLSLLIDKKADINQADKQNKTPLHLAIETQNIDLIRLLIKQIDQLSINALDGQDGKGRTPLKCLIDNYARYNAQLQSDNMLKDRLILKLLLGAYKKRSEKALRNEKAEILDQVTSDSKDADSNLCPFFRMYFGLFIKDRGNDQKNPYVIWENKFKYLSKK